MSYQDLQLTDLLAKLKGSTLWVTLNRPEYCNAISLEMISSLESVFNIAAEDEAVRVVVLTGAGRHFCAGGDITAMENKTGMFQGKAPELRERYRKGIQRIPLLLEKFSKPLIAAVNGSAIGAGCDLSCMCDLRVGTSLTIFSETFAKLNLVPGDGGTYFLSRAIGYARALDMFMTGRKVGADEAFSMGLLSRLSSVEKLESTVTELALDISRQAPMALGFTKEALKRAHRESLEQQLEYLATLQALSQRSDDHFEALRARTEKREPQFLNQ